jgi:hypothetical protein
MKTVVFFLFTCFIVTGALYGALYAEHPFILYAVAAGMIYLFSRYCARRQRKQAVRRDMENYFLSQYRRAKR